MGRRRTPVVLGFSLAECVRTAAKQTDLKLEAIAAAMGLTRSELSHASSTRDRFPFDRLLMAVEKDPDVARFYDTLLIQIDLALGRERQTLEQLLRQALALVEREQAPARRAS